MAFSHVPVLLQACIEGLNLKPDGIYVDGTLGGAGHALEIVKRIPSGRLIGIDRDEVALKAARERLSHYAERVTLVHDNFEQIPEILRMQNIPAVDGILCDLGVSSPQLDDAARGFSYMRDAPLDMRMDGTASLSAFAVVNEYPRAELRRILFTYGEERYAPLIAAAIEREREKSPIQTTRQLSEIIKRAMPAAALREQQHPAKRTFQAIRIAVNDELSAVERLMQNVIPVLKPGGRLCVIAFHSLEDRVVKRGMQMAAQGCTCPKEFPICVCGKEPQMKLITKKPITATDEELEENPRARSAKLRIAERITGKRSV